MEALADYRDRDKMADDNNVVLKDYWAILLLKSCGYSELFVDEKVKENGAPEHTYTFPEEANETYQDYIAGKEILVDFHKVEHFAGLFKKRLHGRK
jgi:hypothetical protein